MKFCKDCKHYQAAERFYDDVCTHPKVGAGQAELMVRGVASDRKCATARIWTDECGKEARYFEPKVQAIVVESGLLADEISGIKGIVAK